MNIIATVNTNAKVRVRLTPEGQDILRQTDGAHVYIDERDGWYYTLLWSLMTVFGPHLRLGHEAPFVGAEIQLLD